MTHVSIEYAHIYTDEEFGSEHIKGVETARQVSLDLATEGKSSIGVVMIDEYHPVTQSLIMTDFLDELEGNGMLPHFVMMEGDLRELSYRLLYSIPKAKRKDFSKYMEKKDSFPCSLLTATWYLYRLGCLTASHIKPIKIRGGLNEYPFSAQELINILPERFQEIEERVIELLKASPWTDRVKDIKYEWI